MHLYAQDFDERETFDNKLALHPSVLAVPWLGLEIFQMGTWRIVGGKSPYRIGLDWTPDPNGRTSWLINGGCLPLTKWDDPTRRIKGIWGGSN